MFSLTFAQMRRSIGRLTAAGIAIAIGTAFVAATLLASDVLKRATYDSVAAQYGSSDLVLRSDSSFSGESRISSQQLDQVRETDGVAAADPVATTYLQLTHGGSSLYQATIGTTTSPRLQPLTVAEGTLPGSDTEIALPEDTARLLDVAVGDTVTEVSYPAFQEEGDVEPITIDTTLTVTGIVDDPYKAYAAQGGAAVVASGLFAERQGGGGDPLYPEVAVELAPGADVETVRSELLGLVDPETVQVVTKDEAAEASVNSATDGQQVFTVVILAFAAIAMIVAALVISNTFQVLVAQRTRTLALLRCVGAKKRQLRGSVVLEAATLGLVTSAVGLLLGTGLVQVALMVLRRADLDFPLPASITLSVPAVVWPLVVGTLVTVVASLVPARAATRVSPLEAMRPSDAPTLAAGGGRFRLVISLLLGVGGTLLMGAGVYAGSLGQLEAAVAAGVLGGATSFVGILVGSVFWLPRLIGLVGRLLGSAGPSARLAGANITRNPRRTAATSTALLIGVTLVAMMSVAASSARVSLASTLDSTYNVDIIASSGVVDPDSAVTSTDGPLTPAVLGELGSLEGVAAVAPVSEVLLGVEGSNTSVAQEPVSVVTADSARQALRDPSILDGLDATHAVISPFYAQYMLGEGQTLTFTGPGGSLTLDVVVADLKSMSVVVDEAAIASILPETAPTSAWIQVTDLDEVGSTVNEVRDTLSADAVSVTGAAVERATMQQAIDTILAVVLGLLAIAVVIALVGVANTLSLSVLERRRESATLRAIGLSKRQLRLTLACEGTLIAGVGAVLGILLGLVYGWVGTIVVLGEIADVTLTVPVVPLALVLLISLAAGLLASVIPGRTAARTSPVEALAVD